MSKQHELKILPVHFNAVVAGKKRAELRKFDRHYSEGDNLLLREWTGEGGYTGKMIRVEVTHIANVGECAPGYLLLSFIVLS